MAKARKHQVSLEATPYYHCTSRCVRQAFLCGFNRLTGKDYEHRRQWVEDRLLLLTQVFCIDICSYAVMSNHLHVVMHINQSTAEALTNKDVCERWHQLYKGTLLTHKFVQGEALSKAELNAVLVKVKQWRSHLFNISWFMRALNEPIARQANAEDQCTGRFWEGRFTSQALLDEKALMACMAYVDLNPIRAKMAKTPEASDHTSVQKRILTLSNQDTKHTQPNTLLPFTGNLHEQKPQGLPFFLKDYLELIDWTGRAIRPDKRGSINQATPPILERLHIEPENWLTLATQFEKRCKGFAGSPTALSKLTDLFGYQRTPGLAQSRLLFQ